MAVYLIARIQAHSLLGPLLRRADHIEPAGEPVRHPNPTIREHLPVSVVPSEETR